MTVKQHLRTALSSLWHANKKQAFFHGLYALRTLYYCTPIYPMLEDPMSAPSTLALTPPKLWRGKASIGKKMAEDSIFTIYGQTVIMDEKIQWNPPVGSSAWIRYLHSFEWLMDLRECGDSGRTKAIEMIEDWLDNCNHFNKTTWEAEALSGRIINWLAFYNWLEDDMSEETRVNMRLSIARQADHLSRNIEWHVDGYAVISNLKALVYTGLCLPSHQTAYLDAIEILNIELKKQVHHDGGHISRIPSVHFAILKELIDIQAMVRKAGQTPPIFLNDTIDRMAAAHEFMLHADGKLALFHHAKEGDKAVMKKVLARCDAQMLYQNHMPDYGFVRLSEASTTIIADVGKPNTDTLYGWQHSQIGSFELCINDERVFVNSGGFRKTHHRTSVYRASTAHNTSTVNGEDAVDLLPKGRIGRTPKNITTKVTSEKNVGSGFTLEHDGFSHVHKTKALRTIFIAKNGSVVGEDAFESAQACKASSFFNIHPQITCHVVSEGEALLTLKNGENYKFLVKGATIHEAESFYAPNFGEEIHTKRLVLRANSRHNNCIIKWALKKA